MRVTLVDPEADPREDATPSEATALVAEVSGVPAAPPLAVRPVEDADWTFHN